MRPSGTPLPNEACAARGRSYSDAHALVDPKTSSDHAPSPTPPGITAMGNGAVGDAGSPSNRQARGKKKHRSRHHHHHHGTRPRSKSLDLHRHHSTPVHKKKHPNHHHRHVYHAHSHGGGASPRSPKLTGKMWIRVATDPPPFLPALAGVAPSPGPVEVGGFDDSMNTSPLNRASSRRASNAPSPSPASFDDGILLCPPPNESLDMCRLRHHGPARIIFGESGKPIKPKPAFDPYNPNATAL